MKKVFPCCLFLYCIILLTPRPSNAQTGQWAWMKGSSATNQYGLYQSMPVTPGSRKGGASWTDAAGNLWVFGGNGHAGGTATGLMNDLWKFDKITGTWSWVKGSNMLDQPGTYGTQGIAAPANTPGARRNSAFWTDNAGNFWLFGGTGIAASNASTQCYNDLWKYDVSTGNWTWIKGSNQVDRQGIYGTLGTATPATNPGGRYGSNCWADNSGNLWLFGGIGYGTTDTIGTLNDLWKYNISTGNWAWIKGSNVRNQPGEYGVLGVAAAANMPGARFGSVSWQDNTGNLWLFGGGGLLPNITSGGGTCGDLWKYNMATSNWTWMKGSKIQNEPVKGGMQGVPDDTNTPGARFFSSTWKDGSGNLWLFGGHQNYNIYSLSYAYDFNDLWKYDVGTGNWTWVKGSPTLNQPGTYGTQGAAGAGNAPGARDMAFAQADNTGNLWLLGGMGYASGVDYGYENDLWKYDLTTGNWTWLKGGNTADQRSIYAPVTITPTDKNPGARTDAYSWTDNSGNLWLFGGYGFPADDLRGYLNDLWKYDIQSGNWAWVKGSMGLHQPGIYGTQGVATDTSYPGSRYAGASGKDAQGNFWLFGGYGYGNSGSYGELSDLWKWDITTGRWAWMKGPGTNADLGTYGSLGVAAASSNPRARAFSASWTDKSGNLWVFGGAAPPTRSGGINPVTTPNVLNDLWKYDISTGNWTWMKGSSSSNQRSVYGTQGTAAATNMPGSRIRSTAWTDTSGNLWLLGGNGYDATSSGSLNDLWKYDITTGNWTWVKGGSTINQPTVYGTVGMADPTNTPGGGQYTTAWTDRNNCLWLFGGSSSTGLITGYLNSIWKYDIATGNWTWIRGSTATNQPGTYGTQGTAAAANQPGSRSMSTSWADGNGNLWLFGGVGYPAAYGYLSDLWKYNDGSVPLPLKLTSFEATRQGSAALLQWATGWEQNITSFTVERSGDGRFFTPVGTVSASGNPSAARQYRFTDAQPLKAANYYRLAIREKDGKVNYSEIRLLNFGAGSQIALFPNPAKSKAVLTGVEAGMTIRIMSAAGQTMTIQKATGTTVQPPVNLLPAGLYQVQVYNGNGKLLGSTTMARE